MLAAAGATLQNVVRVLIFITDPSLQDEFNEVYQSYFGNHLPPRTFVTVPALVHKDMLVEVEVTAALPTDGARQHRNRGGRPASSGRPRPARRKAGRAR